jgi:replicative DNA helicase
MQVYSQDMELRCIKTLTSTKIPERIRSTLLGHLNVDYFHYPPTAAAFERIAIVAKKRFELMSFVDLVEHPALSEDFRDILKDAEVKSVKSKKAMSRMVDSLDDYRKIRIVVDTASKALDQLESDSVDIDELLNVITDKITKARRNIGQEDEFIIIGGKNNKHADDIVHEVLNNLVEPMIPTGFTDYDNRNGGLPEEGVVLLAATTSGGKTAVLMNLMVNLYLLSNKRVCRISLEMGDKQEMQRVLSRLSGVAFWKIKQGKLNPKEKLRIKKAYANFKKHGAKNSAEFTTICPTRNMTIDDALRMIKPYGFDVVGIDYVGLLDGVNDDNQWKVLSNIIRDCKVFSRETKSLIIVLCQLDDESDKLRYSKGMKEHADVMFSWNYSKKEQRELKILPINVDKARDGELFSFQLGERFEVMTVDNMSGGGSYDNDDDDDINLSDDSTTSNDDDVEDYALS